ncbi:MAG: HAD family hydrolase [Opitutaceae bacterium]|jgi:phosphoglycolate phosphatase|nr:HAD family hydrolase [Opitutaceae bacterium]
MRLLLWDIDGTLLSTSGAGIRALEASMAAEFNSGNPVDLSDIDWAGRTDRWIARTIFEKYGVEHTSANVNRLLNGYLERLPRHLEELTRALPGVREILAEADKRSDIVQGLLTGNLARGAATKLSHFDLWDYFPFGAFSDDSAVRNDLGPYALERAATHSGHTFDPRDVWIIGDTPRDIECGKVIGARTLAVATGHHSMRELQQHAPDQAVANFEVTDSFWEIVTS